MSTRGDRNTSFFQAACAERRRRNKIGRLRKEDGSWMEEKEKRRFIANYFSDLYRTGGGQASQQLIHAVQAMVTAQMNENLLKEFTAEEIKRALDGIGDLKVPGPDGMPALFYKKFWPEG
jgi:hypothetical protein